MLWDEGQPEKAELRVNKDYAHRFEDRKRKQELDRLRQQYGDVPLDGDDSDDSEAGVEEDDDGEQLTREVDVQIFRTIDAIRTGDPAVRDKGKRFFDELPAAVAPKSRAPPAKAAEKKLSTREYMLSGAHSDSDEDGDGPKAKARRGAAAADDDDALPYAEQQRRLKRAFLSAFDDVEGEGEGEAGGDALLSARKKSEAEKAEEAEEYAAWLKAQLDADKSRPVDERVSLRRYLDEPEGSLSAEDRFLRDYVTKQLWKGADMPGGGGEDEGAHRLNRPAAPDEEEAEEGFSDREAEFERKVNFRFEEPGADRVAANPRRVADSVRREPKKEARRAAEEQRRLAKAAQLEESKRELQRLKALKRDEILSRLERIRTVSGGADAAGLDVEADFDPDTWDEQMGALFNDEYYAAAEHDPVFAESIRRAEAAEEGEEGEEGGRGRASGAYGMDDADDERDARDAPAKGSFEEKVRQMADRIEGDGGRRPDVAAMLGEYYALEYEDLIAGEIPTRFRYREVEPRSFGLSDGELLAASDRELNRCARRGRAAGGGSPRAGAAPVPWCPCRAAQGDTAMHPCVRAVRTSRLLELTCRAYRCRARRARRPAPWPAAACHASDLQEGAARLGQAALL